MEWPRDRKLREGMEHARRLSDVIQSCDPARLQVLEKRDRAFVEERWNNSIKNSGEVWIDPPDTLCYRWGKANWRVRIPDIVAAAEYTTNEGPMVDDWFIVFLTRTARFQMPEYAHGCGNVLRQLESQFHIPLALKLYWSADFNSRMLWPPDVEGQPFYFLTRTNPADAPQTLAQKCAVLIHRLIGTQYMNIRPEIIARFGLEYSF